MSCGDGDWSGVSSDAVSDKDRREGGSGTCWFHHSGNYFVSVISMLLEILMDTFEPFCSDRTY